MAKDNQVLVRVNDPTHGAIEQFAEDRDYNKAEAVRRITESRLKSEGYLTRELYGDGEREIRTDKSGAVIRPILNLMAGLYAAAILVVFSILVIASAGFTASFIPYGELLPTMFSLSIIVALVTVILYTSIPEKADLLIQRKVVDPARRKYYQAKV